MNSLSVRVLTRDYHEYIRLFADGAPSPPRSSTWPFSGATYLPPPLPSLGYAGSDQPEMRIQQSNSLTGGR